MVNIPSVSPNELKNRRQQLKKRRQVKTWQGVWRFLVIGSMAGGLFWVMSLPYWMIKENSQVDIEGNQLLSSEQIQELLAISYPQSLWELSTQQIAQEAEKKPPLLDVEIMRHLFPAKLTVQVRERQPIAIALANNKIEGFLDAKGVFIPKHFYQGDNQTLKSLTFKVMGFQAGYRSHWQELYPLIVGSPVKILAVDWRDPNNLILKTELGTVYFGLYTSQLTDKFNALARLRKLPSRIPVTKLAYIDLTNPNSPVIELKPSPPQPSSTSIVRN